MATNRRGLLGLLATGAALAFFPGRKAARAQEPGLPRTTPALVGTWQVGVSNAAGGRVALITFAADGTLVRTTNQHPLMSPSHGVWRQFGERDFEATFWAFQFDEHRTHTGSQKVSLRLTIGPDLDQFSGVSKASTRALDGTELATIVSQFQGKRLRLEPFDD